VTGPADESADAPAEPGVALLSFDVEEYFQVEAAARSGLSADEWDAWPKRLPQAVDRVLALLAEHGAAATFFVLGWVARHEPDVVRRIADAGHEVASHGMAHRMLQALGRDAFRRGTAWAIDVLAEGGYRYDSSVFPIRHDRYGVPDAPPTPHWAEGPGGGTILEIPPLTLRLAGANWPVGGGGYLRLLPKRLPARALASADRNGFPGMIYLHPWELDPDQPVLPMSRVSRFRHRVGLRRAEGKLRWLLQRFRFASVRQRLEALEANVQETYAYGSRPGTEA